MEVEFMNLYKNIAYYRKLCGYTQEQLAAKLQTLGCDITRSAVAKIEVGQRHLYPDEIILTKEKSLTSFEFHNVLGEFNKPKQYVYEIDLTKYKLFLSKNDYNYIKFEYDNSNINNQIIHNEIFNA